MQAALDCGFIRISGIHGWMISEISISYSVARFEVKAASNSYSPIICEWWDSYSISDFLISSPFWLYHVELTDPSCIYVTRLRLFSLLNTWPIIGVRVCSYAPQFILLSQWTISWLWFIMYHITIFTQMLCPK